MGQVIDWQSLSVQGSQSPLGFDETENWSRYLTLDGQRAYLIGGKCDTCGLMFERLNGANRNVPVKELSAQLSQGIQRLDETVLNSFSSLLPDGPYIATLSQLTPKHVAPGDAADYFCHEQLEEWEIDGFIGLPHYPRTKYYRGVSRQLDDHRQFYEFVNPMFPENWLDQERLAYYRERLSGGAAPTAVAISVLDVRQEFQRTVSHWCLAHYLLDGHHKLYAASLATKPVTLLSFVAVNHGVSDEDQIKEMLDFW